MDSDTRPSERQVTLHPSHVADQDAWMAATLEQDTCPLCQVCNTRGQMRFREHLQLSHLKHSVKVGEILALPCKRSCKPKAQNDRHTHYHCVCGSLISRKATMINHILRNHTSEPGTNTSKPTPLAAPVEKTDGLKARAPSRRKVAASGPKLIKRHNNEKCPICGKVVLKKSLKRHIDSIHKQCMEKRKHCSGVVVDPNEGIFMISQSVQGSEHPLHVQFKVSHSAQMVWCENEHCRSIQAASGRGNAKYVHCRHIKAVQYADPFPEPQRMDRSVLHRLVEEQIVRKESQGPLERLVAAAEAKEAPVVVSWYAGYKETTRYMFLSVYHDYEKAKYYAPCGRTVVRLDTKTSTLHCSCNQKKGCLHKKLSWWHLAQCHAELLSGSVDLEGDASTLPSSSQDPQHDPSDISCSNHTAYYPPAGPSMQHTMQYMKLHKKISPNVKPIVISSTLEALAPKETVCHLCSDKPPLSQPLLVTKSGKLVDMYHIQGGICIYVKKCPKCDTYYRYQEVADGLHNFDDHTLISLALCLFLRSCIKNHTAVGRGLDILADVSGLIYPKATLHAYLHFESLTDHSYDYCCIQCGHSPPILILDANRKGVFRLPVKSLKVPQAEDAKDMVDMSQFWNHISSHVLGKGFSHAGAEKNPYDVELDYCFWSPWICPSSVNGREVFNTEYKKCPEFKATPKVDQVTGDVDDEKDLTEEFIIDLLCESTVARVRAIAKGVGVSPNGRKLDVIARLQEKLGDTSIFKKVFSAIWGCSGGFLTASCIHKVVYGVKALLRGESVRDHIDIILSQKHIPTIVINDLSGMTAVHGNIRQPGMFQPFNGRLADADDPNIMQAVKAGNFKCSLPFMKDALFNRMVDSDHTYSEKGLHPLTHTSERYCLSDEFHKTNLKSDKDKLRDVSLVPELAGIINTQAQEQIYRKIVRDIYFLNMFSPGNYMFVLRLILHLWNQEINSSMVRAAIDAIEVGHKLSIGKDGRLIITAHPGEDVIVDVAGLNDYTREIRPNAHYRGEVPVDEQAGQESGEASADYGIKKQNAVSGEHYRPKPSTVVRAQLSKYMHGLRNPGNNCWFNSGLQALKHYIQVPSTVACGMLQAIGYLMDSLCAPTSKADEVDPLQAMMLVQGDSDWTTYFTRSGDQQDAMQFIELFVRRLHETHLNIIEMVHISTERKCLTCDTTYMSDEVPNASINLAFKEKCSVQTSMDTHLEWEAMTDQECPYCETCEQHRACVMRIHIHNRPATLVLQIKRFEVKRHSDGSHTTRKISTPVSIDRTLHISLGGDKQSANVSVPTTSEAEYSLVAVQCHGGQELTSGHYWAYGVIGDTTVYYNDELVEVGDTDKLMSAKKTRETCYILHYVKKVDIVYVTDHMREQVQKLFDEQPSTSVVQEVQFHRSRIIVKWHDLKRLDIGITAEQILAVCEKLKSIDPWDVGYLNCTVHHIPAYGLPVVIVCPGMKDLVTGTVIDAFLQLQCSKKAPGHVVLVPCSVYLAMEQNPATHSQFLRHIEFLRAKKILLPVNQQGNHWCLVVLDIEERCIIWYNSLSKAGIPSAVMNNISNYFKRRNQLMPLDAVDISTWRRHHPTLCPRQTDGNNCGVFVCMYGLAEVEDINLALKKIDLNEARIHICFAILSGDMASADVGQKTRESTDDDDRDGENSSVDEGDTLNTMEEGSVNSRNYSGKVPVNLPVAPDQKKRKYSPRIGTKKRKRSSFLYPESGVIKKKAVTHCLCDKQNDGSLYWQCDRCQKWFHPDCLGLEAQDEPENFVCVLCEKKSKLLTEGCEDVLDNEGYINEEILSKIEKKLLSMMRCSDNDCAKPDHERHHAFISQPDHFLKISRKKAGYGSNKMGVEVLDNLTKALKERLFSVKRIDPKHPYSGGTIFTLKGTLEQSQLKAVFDSRHMIAAHYIIYVLSNEAAAHLYAIQTGISYQYANKILVEGEFSTSLKHKPGV